MKVNSLPVLPCYFLFCGGLFLLTLLRRAFENTRKFLSTIASSSFQSSHVRYCEPRASVLGCFQTQCLEWTCHSSFTYVLWKVHITSSCFCNPPVFSQHFFHTFFLTAEKENSLMGTYLFSDSLQRYKCF